MKKKILFIYYQNIKQNGISKAIANLSKNLIEEGYDISILFLMEEHDDFFPIDGRVKKIYINSFNTKQFQFASRVKKKFGNKGKIDNLIYNLYDYGVFLLLKNWIKEHGKEYNDIISCWYKLSTYLTFTDVANKTTAWEHISYKTGGFIYFKLFRHRYSKLKKIVCLTDGSLDYYKSLNPNSLKIPNIIGDQFEEYKLNREAKKNNILLAGRLDPEKNVKDFLEIIKDAELPNNWTVTIAGAGTESEMLKKLAENLMLDNVNFLGTVPSEKMFDLFQTSKIFCMTSLSEGLPTTLIEAMFLGNVLISYDCPTGPSEIVNKKNGFLIPLMDKQMFREKLTYLVNNPEILHETMEISFEEAKKWGKDGIVEKWTKQLS